MLRLNLIATCLLLTLPTAGCDRWELDHRMDELCARDGGIRVLETVAIPANNFDANGNPFPGRQPTSDGERLGTEYQLLRTVELLRNGDPLKGQGRLDRTVWRVIRLADGKILSEAVSYGRSGGDLIVIGHFSSKSCPIRLGAPRELLRATFVQGSPAVSLER